MRTSLHSLGTLPELMEAVARKLDEGAQVYWVCPLVAESEALDLAAAEARFAVLRERFGEPVGLAHGRQDAAVRDATLAAFARGDCRLLVATTVVEVGVDVPAATVMVIEHAERFGLAQLHQLRGRVGRGAAASFCLLLHEEWVNDAAKRRLTLLRDTDDGFLIADEDFRLRGGGDLLGTKQSGLPGFRLADPIEHEGLLHMANRDAAVLLGKDPKLDVGAREGGAGAAAAVREGGGDADAGGGVMSHWCRKPGRSLGEYSGDRNERVRHCLDCQGVRPTGACEGGVFAAEGRPMDFDLLGCKVDDPDLGDTAARV